MQHEELTAQRYKAQLKALMRLAHIMDAAGEGVLGKGAPAMMYQAGRDAGLAEGTARAGISDVHEALAAVLVEGDEVWQVELWQEGGGPLPAEASGRSDTWVLFRRCPLLALARRAGTRPGGILCQALHGYLSGSMEAIIGRRVDMKVDHCGPRACKVLLELKG